VDKPWKKDLKLKKMFVINQFIDANKPSFNVAPGDEDEKTLGMPLRIFRGDHRQRSNCLIYIKSRNIIGKNRNFRIVGIDTVSASEIA